MDVHEGEMREGMKKEWVWMGVGKKCAKSEERRIESCSHKKPQTRIFKYARRCACVNISDHAQVCVSVCLCVCVGEVWLHVCVCEWNEKVCACEKDRTSYQGSIRKHFEDYFPHAVTKQRALLYYKVKNDLPILNKVFIQHLRDKFTVQIGNWNQCPSTHWGFVKVLA